MEKKNKNDVGEEKSYHWVGLQISGAELTKQWQIQLESAGISLDLASSPNLQTEVKLLSLAEEALPNNLFSYDARITARSTIHQVLQTLVQRISYHPLEIILAAGRLYNPTISAIQAKRLSKIIQAWLTTHLIRDFKVKLYLKHKYLITPARDKANEAGGFNEVFVKYLGILTWNGQEYDPLIRQPLPVQVGIEIITPDQQYYPDVPDISPDAKRVKNTTDNSPFYVSLQEQEWINNIPWAEVVDYTLLSSQPLVYLYLEQLLKQGTLGNAGIPLQKLIIWNDLLLTNTSSAEADEITRTLEGGISQLVDQGDSALVTGMGGKFLVQAKNLADAFSLPSRQLRNILYIKDYEGFNVHDGIGKLFHDQSVEDWIKITLANQERALPPMMSISGFMGYSKEEITRVAQEVYKQTDGLVQEDMDLLFVNVDNSVNVPCKNVDSLRKFQDALQIAVKALPI